MPFRYRLQKFLEIRIKRKEEQLQEVIKAQNEVIRIENLIEENKREIVQIRSDMRKADPHMFERYDTFLKHLYEKGEKLEQEKEDALKELEKQKELLREREKEVNVLEKHKEHKKDEYIYEQKAAELKQLSEVGSQKHFRTLQEQKAESGED